MGEKFCRADAWEMSPLSLSLFIYDAGLRRFPVRCRRIFSFTGLKREREVCSPGAALESPVRLG